MKRKFSLFFLCVPVILSAQTIEFTDLKFEQVLLLHCPTIDMNNDKKIQIEEAKTVTELNLSKQGIADISEIRYFTNLRSLDCQDNKIAMASFEDLKDLRFLNCSKNEMTQLTLRRLPELRELIAEKNGLTRVVFENCSNIEILKLKKNQISGINVKSVPKLKYLDLRKNELKEIDISDNMKLEEVHLDPKVLKVSISEVENF